MIGKTFDIITRNGNKVGNIAIANDNYIYAEWNFGGILWYELGKLHSDDVVRLQSHIHLCTRCAHNRNLLNPLTNPDCEEEIYVNFPVEKCDSHAWDDENNHSSKQGE